MNSSTDKFQRVGYKRVGSVDQNTDRQLADLEVPLDKIFEEKISGKDTNRPELQKMLEYIRAGDVVYVHSLDRLARNLSDLLSLVKTITDKGCTIHFVKQHMSFSSESTDPTSKLMLSVMGAVAEFERAIIKERQREGIKIAKEKGRYSSGRPVSMTQEKVNLFLEKKKQGVPLTKIAKELGVTRQTLYRVMEQKKI